MDRPGHGTFYSGIVYVSAAILPGRNVHFPVCEKIKWVLRKNAGKKQEHPVSSRRQRGTFSPLHGRGICFDSHPELCFDSKGQGEHRYAARQAS